MTQRMARAAAEGIADVKMLIAAAVDEGAAYFAKEMARTSSLPTSLRVCSTVLGGEKRDRAKSMLSCDHPTH
jgi:hypothetical protein